MNIDPTGSSNRNSENLKSRIGNAIKTFIGSVKQLFSSNITSIFKKTVNQYDQHLKNSDVKDPLSPKNKLDETPEEGEGSDMQLIWEEVKGDKSPIDPDKIEFGDDGHPKIK